MKARFLHSTLIGLLGSAASVAAEATAPAAKAAPPSVWSDHMLDRVVAWMQTLFNADDGKNSIGHFIAAGVLFLAAILLRKIITHVIFAWLKKLAEKTTTTLDDKLFPALEPPVAWLVFVFLSFAGLKVLVLPAWADLWVGHAFDVAWVAVVFWGMLRALNAIVDHLNELGEEKGLGLGHFIPLIKKTLGIILVIFAAITVAQRMGVDVKAFVAGLGIGGLAFALAAQDTLANFFGSMVVAIDRPFKVGEYVRIGSAEGTVEDIGLRSTKLRTGSRNLMVLPNKMVANEIVSNLSRMPQRRVDQTIGLTYNTSADQMQGILDDIRALLRADPDIHQQLIAVNFTAYNASSLDIQILYFCSNPDWTKHLEVRERINLKIMRAVAARGLAFAFPTQTIDIGDDVARKLGGLRPEATAGQ